VAHREAEKYGGWKEGPVPSEHAIRGFHSVTLMEANFERTSTMLTEIMGFKLVGVERDRSVLRWVMVILQHWLMC